MCDCDRDCEWLVLRECRVCEQGADGFSASREKKTMGGGKGEGEGAESQIFEGHRGDAAWARFWRPQR